MQVSCTYTHVTRGDLGKNSVRKIIGQILKMLVGRLVLRLGTVASSLRRACWLGLQKRGDAETKSLGCGPGGAGLNGKKKCRGTISKRNLPGSAFGRLNFEIAENPLHKPSFWIADNMNINRNRTYTEKASWTQIQKKARSQMH